MALLPATIDTSELATRAHRYADLFTLPLRERNWRGNPGDFAGLGVGSSLDFQDHRNYLPGDDPRHINWQAFARTGDYTLKLYREEVRPVVEILFDCSGSMLTVPEKALRALELLHFAFFSAERCGAAAHLTLVKGAHWKPLDSHALLSGHWKEIAEELPSTDSAEAPQLAPIPFRPRSMRVFISDLLFASGPEITIQALQHNHGRAVILCPFSLSESRPAWDGNYEFVDTETSAHHDRRIDASLLRRYEETYRMHFERWKADAIRAQAPLARILAEAPFDEAVKREAIPSGAIQLA